jgi:hypothetical protein
MNDEKRFSASTPIVPKSADGTPPDRQIPLPLTPPANNDLQSTSNPQSPVSAVLDLIKQRQCHKSTSQSRQLKVKPLEYKILLARLERHMHVDGAHKSTLELFKPECYSYPLTAANNESTRLLFALPRSTTSCIWSSIFCKNRSYVHTGFHPILCTFSATIFSLHDWLDITLLT